MAYSVLYHDIKSTSQSLRIAVCKDEGDIFNLYEEDHVGNISIIKAPLTSEDQIVYAVTRNIDDPTECLPVDKYELNTVWALSALQGIAERDKMQSIVNFKLSNGLDMDTWIIDNMYESLTVKIENMLPNVRYSCINSNSPGDCGGLYRLDGETSIRTIQNMLGSTHELSTSSLRSLDRLISQDEDTYLYTPIGETTATILHKDRAKKFTVNK